MQLVGRRYDTGEVVRVVVSGGLVQQVTPFETGDEVPWIAPGFVDLQVNGYGGQEFSSAELRPEHVARIIRKHFAFGVTSLFPTVTTQSFSVIEHAMRAIAAACEDWPDVARAVVGIHLEGPYISSDDGPRGAHPLEHCREPEFEEFQRFQRAAGGRIKIVTLSPEYNGSSDFIRRIVAEGVLAAIGHTSADSVQIRAAVDAGARLSTHLGNGAHRTLPRHPNYIWDQLAEDRLVASLIVDGHHLPPEVVKTFVRAKTPSRIILVSDISGMAGSPPGRYSTDLCELEILTDGRLVIAGQDQLLAGASQPISVGVENLLRLAKVDLATAVDAASTLPARLAGIPCGRLTPGARADLVLFDLDCSAADTPGGRLHVRETIAAGEKVFQQQPDS